MLKIKCIYCGQKILADDGKMGTKARCPKCDHSILINEAALIKGDEKDLSDAEIGLLLEKAKDKGLDNQSLVRKKVSAFLQKWFVPEFDELSLFLMVVAAVLVAGTNNDIGEKFDEFAKVIIEVKPSREIIVIFAVIGLGLFFVAALPVFHIFSKRGKYEWEKTVMMVFAILFTAGSGIYAGRAMMEEAREGIDFSKGMPSFFPYAAEVKAIGWRAIFPLWNILNGTILIWFFQAGLIDTKCIIDRNVKLWEVLLGLIILVGVFAICQYTLVTHWAVTYSICIVYSTNFVRWGHGKNA